MNCLCKPNDDDRHTSTSSRLTVAPSILPTENSVPVGRMEGATVNPLLDYLDFIIYFSPYLAPVYHWHHARLCTADDLLGRHAAKLFHNGFMYSLYLSVFQTWTAVIPTNPIGAGQCNATPRTNSRGQKVLNKSVYLVLICASNGSLK